jgi:hypothetical protein
MALNETMMLQEGEKRTPRDDEADSCVCATGDTEAGEVASVLVIWDDEKNAWAFTQHTPKPSSCNSQVPNTSKDTGGSHEQSSMLHSIGYICQGKQ